MIVSIRQRKSAPIIICEICKKEFKGRNKPKGKTSRFCSKECSRINEIANTQDVSERFWSKVKVGDPDDCWPYQNFINPDGYGMFRVSTIKTIVAHKFAYEDKIGKVSEGLVLLHECDFGACCNPAHLKPGTNKENNQDMWNKNRGNPRPGIRHHNVKLTEDEVLKIRSDYEIKPEFYTDISKRYIVSPATISGIIRRDIWKHI